MKKQILVLASLMLVFAIYLNAQNDMWGTGTSGQILKVDYLEDPFGSTYRLIMEPSILTEYNSNIGVGVIQPSEKLHISGNILSSGNIVGTNLQGNIIKTPSIRPILAPSDIDISATLNNNRFLVLENGNFSLGDILISHTNYESKFEVISIEESKPAVSITSNATTYGKGLLIKSNSAISEPLAIKDNTNTTVFKIMNNGNIDFTGYLKQNGNEIKPSPWLEQGDDIYFDSGDVDIDNNLQVGSLTTYGNAAFLSDIVFLQGPGNIGFVNQIQGANDLTLNGDNDGTDIFISGSGNVGIGTSTPTQKLDVEQTTSGQYAMRLFNTNDSGGNGLLIESNGGNNDDILLNIVGDKNGTPKEVFYVDGDGVGIGTNSPDSELEVDGEIICTLLSTEDLFAQEIVVDITNPWHDYVFEDNYNLLSLSELEEYINLNKHLPEIPSAKEVEDNGINVAEMNGLLLKKIEELTLYIIELEKDVQENSQKIRR